MDSRNVKFTALLEPKIFERLRKESYETKRSVSHIIRMALSFYWLYQDLSEYFEKVRKRQEVSPVNIRIQYKDGSVEELKNLDKHEVLNFQNVVRDSSKEEYVFGNKLIKVKKIDAYVVF